MRFPYHDIRIQGTGTNRVATVWRPLIPFRVFGPTGRVPLLGWADTGSDDTILPIEIAPALGVIFRPTDWGRTEGMGGNFIDLSFADVDLELTIGDESFRWTAWVAFTDGRKVILGNRGFLARFTATFDPLGRHVTLIRNGTELPPLYL